VANLQTDRHTDNATYDICSYRPHLCTAPLKRVNRLEILELSAINISDIQEVHQSSIFSINVLTRNKSCQFIADVTTANVREAVPRDEEGQQDEFFHSRQTYLQPSTTYSSHASHVQHAFQETSHIWQRDLANNSTARRKAEQN